MDARQLYQNITSIDIAIITKQKYIRESKDVKSLKAYKSRRHKKKFFLVEMPGVAPGFPQALACLRANLDIPISASIP